jgi:hypothetical protein
MDSTLAEMAETSAARADAHAAEARDRARRAQAVGRLAGALDACLKAGARREAAEFLAGAVEILSAGSPEAPLFDGARAEAALWAEAASPPELECYALAALERLGRAGLAERARKRMLAALWGQLDPASRRAFLRRADPEGTLRAGR